MYGNIFFEIIRKYRRFCKHLQKALQIDVNDLHSNLIFDLSVIVNNSTEIFINKQKKQIRIMYISKVKIENFRSIKNTEIELTKFNIFVGQNNCGKTNFFEALDFFFNGYKGNINDLKHKRIENLDVKVEVEFSDVQDGIEKMHNEKNKSTLKTKVGDTNKVSIVRSTQDVKKRKMLIDSAEVNPGTGFDSALNDFLPKFEYISTKQYYDSVAKYSKTTPMGIMLSDVLSAVVQNDVKYQEFQKQFEDLFSSEDSQIKEQFNIIGNKVKEYLEQQFPDTNKVTFDVPLLSFDDLLKNFNTDIDDGVETSAEEKGDGMQRALMLAIIETYSDFRKEHDDFGKSFVFLIDEAELHLHPTAQRKLKEVLLNLSKGSDQVLINTHSSVFVADDYDNQKIFKVEKTEGETTIDASEETDKPYIVYELLGGTPADLLLPRNFLIVEGRSEFELLNRIIKKFYLNKPKIQIVEAHGDIDQAKRTINAIEKLYTPLKHSIYKDKLVILLDCPSQQTENSVNTFKKENSDLEKNKQLFILPKRDIEQCYPDHPDDIYGNWRKTQEEVDKMKDSKKKKQLAKYVGENILQEEFEKEMPDVFNALERAWELSF